MHKQPNNAIFKHQIKNPLHPRISQTKNQTQKNRNLQRTHLRFSPSQTNKPAAKLMKINQN